MLSLLRAYLLSYSVHLFIFILFIMIFIPLLIEATAQSQPFLPPGQQQMTNSLGVIGIPVTPDIAQALNLSQPLGNLVINVVEGSPADKANLKGGYTIANIDGREVVIGGDVILTIDNRAATTTNDIRSYLDTKKVGDVVQLSILRDGKLRQFLSLLLRARHYHHFGISKSHFIQWPHHRYQIQSVQLNL